MESCRRTAAHGRRRGPSRRPRVAASRADSPERGVLVEGRGRLRSRLVRPARRAPGRGCPPVAWVSDRHFHVRRAAAAGQTGGFSGRHDASVRAKPTGPFRRGDHEGRPFRPPGRGVRRAAGRPDAPAPSLPPIPPTAARGARILSASALSLPTQAAELRKEGLTRSPCLVTASFHPQLSLTSDEVAWNAELPPRLPPGWLDASRKARPLSRPAPCKCRGTFARPAGSGRDLRNPAIPDRTGPRRRSAGDRGQMPSGAPRRG